MAVSAFHSLKLHHEHDIVEASNVSGPFSLFDELADPILEHSSLSGY